jgi:hypothetical protein
LLARSDDAIHLAERPLAVIFRQAQLALCESLLEFGVMGIAGASWRKISMNQMFF